MKKNRRKFLRTISAGTLAIGTGIITAPFSAPFVHANKKYSWKMVTTWPKNFPALGTGANYLAELIEKMSDGQIQIKIYGAGELVPAMGVFDAVKRGTAQMGHGAAYYWKGKHEAAQFFAAVPFGLTAMEMNGWLAYGGGQKLWDELYMGFGLKPFNAGNTGVQMGGWFNKEIKTVEDFKGLKMRMPGLGADVLTQLNATVVTLPGGEIFQALKTGSIDATEWIGPYNDLAFGLHKAAKFYYWPGWHEPGTTLECIVHKETYEQLPKNLQTTIQAACHTASLDMLAEFTARNASSLAELVKQHKVVLKKFPDPVLEKINIISSNVTREIAKKDGISKKIFESFNDFREKSIGWGKISEEGYRLARTLTKI